MLAQLQALSTTTGAYVFVVVLGLLWGSFANVCIYRWPPTEEFPHGRSVVTPGSHCFVCKREIPWYDNVPLLAYLWLRGKCRFCKTPFSARYLIVEALTGVLFGVAWWFAISLGEYREPFDVTLVRFAIHAAFCFVMIVVTFIDLDHKLILNKLTIPSVVVFYAATFLLPERRWWEGLVGIGIGYGVPWLIGELYFRITKREGLGLGDSMLLAVIGALLGWKGVVVSLFGGSVLGSVIGITSILVGKEEDDEEGDGASNPASASASDSESASASASDSASASESDSASASASDSASDSASESASASASASASESASASASASASDSASALAQEPASAADKASAAPDPSASPARAEGPADEPEAPADGGILKMELPFGPFLAMGALVYMFGEPWIHLVFAVFR